MMSPGAMEISQWSTVTRTITAESILTNPDGSVASRSRLDLTDAVVYFTVRDEDDSVVISKRSSSDSDIEILNQVDESTRGQVNIKFTSEDTEDLTPGDKYWFDCWAALSDGTKDAIVDRGRFHVRKSVTNIAEVAPSEASWPESYADLHARLGVGTYSEYLKVPDALNPDPGSDYQEMVDVETGETLGDYEFMHPGIGRDPFYGRFVSINQTIPRYTSPDPSIVYNFWGEQAGDFCTLFVTRPRLVPGYPGYEELLLWNMSSFWAAEHAEVRLWIDMDGRLILRLTPKYDPGFDDPPLTIAEAASSLSYTDRVTPIAVVRRSSRMYAVTDLEEISIGTWDEVIESGGRWSLGRWGTGFITAPQDVFRVAYTQDPGDLGVAHLKSLMDSIGRP